jgi:hypothetical protein
MHARFWNIESPHVTDADRTHDGLAYPPVLPRNKSFPPPVQQVQNYNDGLPMKLHGKRQNHAVIGYLPCSSEAVAWIAWLGPNGWNSARLLLIVHFVADLIELQPHQAMFACCITHGSAGKLHYNAI